MKIIDEQKVKTLSAVAVLLLSLAWLPAWGQDTQDHHPKVDAAHPIEPPTFVEPPICKTVDNLPKDHVWKHEESWIVGSCISAIVNGKREWPSEAAIERSIAQMHAEEAAKDNNQKGKVVQLTPKH